MAVVAVVAPMGIYPPLSPPAIVMMSGSTPQWSTPNILPVRPSPVVTSSAMSTTPYSLHISRSIGQYSAPGTIPSFVTGSAITAATVLGWWNLMSSSTALAQRTAHSDGVRSPLPYRYTFG